VQAAQADPPMQTFRVASAEILAQDKFITVFVSL
jgi:hypothetical protein